jgi:amino acid permease
MDAWMTDPHTIKMVGPGIDTSQGLTYSQIAYCFFVSIATILGTGILALPVKLYETGFRPFMLTFTLTLFAQVTTVFLMAEVLQRASHILQSRANQSDNRRLLQDDTDTDTEEAVAVQLEDRHPRQTPSLHTLAVLYLDGFGAKVFNWAAMLHFLSILISYALAWSKAFCSIIGCNPTVVIAPCVILFSTGIIVFNKQLQPIITGLTFFKVWPS